MSRIIRILIPNSFLTSSLFFVLVQRILNYYSNFPTYRLYFGEVETPYCANLWEELSNDSLRNRDHHCRGCGVADPHGEEHGAHHEAQHQPSRTLS